MPHQLLSLGDMRDIRGGNGQEIRWRLRKRNNNLNSVFTTFEKVLLYHYKLLRRRKNKTLNLGFYSLFDGPDLLIAFIKTSLSVPVLCVFYSENL